MYTSGRESHCSLNEEVSGCEMNRIWSSWEQEQNACEWEKRKAFFRSLGVLGKGLLHGDRLLMKQLSEKTLACLFFFIGVGCEYICVIGVNQGLYNLEEGHENIQ